MSWAEMDQKDDLDAEEISQWSNQLSNVNGVNKEETSIQETKPKTDLSREHREHIQFCNVKRKKDFICLERVNGKIVNVLDGLELHTGVFSMAEQTRILKFVEKLEEMGKSGQLKELTYTAPKKWMKGKGTCDNPIWSVLVSDVAKHCVPAVPTKRISITFRRMDESSAIMAAVDIGVFSLFSPRVFAAYFPLHCMDVF
ncbi:hypothetical protein K7X08_033834 [Anisodus acutangulus]|uniref:Uncharacterized protein n=1 Tax=Anisodus acutangulus TaxID=402998 RepID=A0A9Q1RDM7_9SOLA|nr:hypothetical protein K7X08_033834 [Anisodus acutangulus]